MTRSRRGQRNLGDEYWSRRPLNGYSPSSENKRITHGIERAIARQEIMEAAKAVDELYEYLRPGLYLLGRKGEYFQPDGVDAEFTVDNIQDPTASSSYLRMLHYTLMLHGY